MSIFDDPYDLEHVFSRQDECFDLIYPREIRELSDRHWTPVAVARKAAEFLVAEPETRVLDLGCGPGKFCIVGALTTAGRFTGVEQRGRLVKFARDAIQAVQISNAEIIHANVADVDFLAYEAFYLFNPFEENLFQFGKIDSTVELSRKLYDEYTRHVAAQLAQAPLGTRVVTYHGLCEEVPMGYDCEDSAFDYTLKLWRKTRDCPAPELSPDARPARDRWRFLLDLVSRGPGQ